MHLTDRVVDIDEHHPVRAGEQARHPRGQAGEQSSRDGVDLLHVTVRERAQIRAERRRRSHPAEHLLHRSVSQEVEIVDAVRAGEQAGDDARGLDGRVR